MSIKSIGISCVYAICVLSLFASRFTALRTIQKKNVKPKAFRISALRAIPRAVYLGGSGANYVISTDQHEAYFTLRRIKVAAAAFSGGAFLFGKRAKASVGAISAGSASTKPYMMTPAQGASLWLVLFSLSAILHGAESAITKISPWKVRQFAEEEGKGSPFSTLSANITRLLSTILLTTTACSIYSTALFVETATRLFPTLSLGLVTAVLTVVTLFFGELFPKALAVSNSELVARRVVPALSRLATVLLPITFAFNKLSAAALSLLGFRNTEDNSVSENMLRMVVNEAVETERLGGDGIEGLEGRMIQAVLDMEDTPVSKIMRPRVAIKAVSEECTLTELLRVVMDTKYSRIPIYRDSVDNIVGVIFSKDLLDYVEISMDEGDTKDGSTKDGGTDKGEVKGPGGGQRQLSSPGRDFANWSASEITYPTYFIPETMKTWNALQVCVCIYMYACVGECGCMLSCMLFSAPNHSYQ